MLLQCNIFPSINGELVDPIIPKRGLRQGDTLLPYLFIIYAEGLFAMLQQAEVCGDLHGCRISRGAPSTPIYYLLMITSFSLMPLNKNVEDAFHYR